jgi:hypothetical protein
VAAVMLNEGAERLATYLYYDSSDPLSLTLRLYVNNHAPVVTDTSAAFTECTLAGYSTVLISSGARDFPTSGGGKATAPFDVTYLTLAPYAGGVTIFGWYLIEDSSGATVLASLLPSPIVVPAGGLILAIQPGPSVSLGV